jgi:nucleoside 2-deoxyribosyltransferase
MLPQDFDGLSNKEVFDRCVKEVGDSDLVLAILDGADSDSGTCFEAGIAFSLSKPILGIRTDFRGCGDDGPLNLMLYHGCMNIVTVDCRTDDLDQLVELVYDALRDWERGMML